MNICMSLLSSTPHLKASKVGVYSHPALSRIISKEDASILSINIKKFILIKISIKAIFKAKSFMPSCIDV